MKIGFMDIEILIKKQKREELKFTMLLFLYTRLLSIPLLWFPCNTNSLITCAGIGKEIPQGFAFSEDKLLLN